MYVVMMKTHDPLKGKLHATIDYSTPVQDLLKKDRCEYFPPEIAALKLFSTKKEKSLIHAKIMYLRNRPVLSDYRFENEMACLKKRGFEPVNLREMITVFNQFRFDIVKMVMALGTIIELDDTILTPVIRRSCYQNRYVVGLEEV